MSYDTAIKYAYIYCNDELVKKENIFYGLPPLEKKKRIDFIFLTVTKAAQFNPEDKYYIDLKIDTI